MTVKSHQLHWAVDDITPSLLGETFALEIHEASRHVMCFLKLLVDLQGASSIITIILQSIASY